MAQIHILLLYLYAVIYHSSTINKALERKHKLLASEQKTGALELNEKGPC